MTDDSERVGGRYPIRPVRMSDSLWTAFMAKAHANGTTASAVVRRAVELYLADRLDMSEPEGGRCLVKLPHPAHVWGFKLQHECPGVPYQ